MSCNCRVGFGYDIHRFCESTSSSVVLLCGIPVHCSRQLCSHSDGDVALHAIMDALLGAACLGDIGDHFPPNDSWKGANSRELLQKVGHMVNDAGYVVGNIDISIACEEPLITPYKASMRESIAELLLLSSLSVNIKATTNEGLGCIGRKEGIAVFAVALLQNR